MSVVLFNGNFGDGAGNTTHTLLNPTIQALPCYYLTSLQFELNWLVNVVGGQSNFGIDLGTFDGTTFIPFWSKTLVFMGLAAGALVPILRDWTIEWPSDLFVKPSAGANMIQTRTNVFQVDAASYGVHLYGTLVNSI